MGVKSTQGPGDSSDESRAFNECGEVGIALSNSRNRVSIPRQSIVFLVSFAGLINAELTTLVLRCERR